MKTLTILLLLSLLLPAWADTWVYLGENFSINYPGKIEASTSHYQFIGTPAVLVRTYAVAGFYNYLLIAIPFPCQKNLYGVGLYDVAKVTHWGSSTPGPEMVSIDYNSLQEMFLPYTLEAKLASIECRDSP